MNIRIAAPSDCSAISRYDRHIPSHRLDACIAEGRLWVLCRDCEILGVLRYSLFWETVPFLDLLYLDERCRCQGWGSRMMARWEEEMRQAGFPWVMLSTQEDETAKFFYEKIGYRRAGAFLPPEQDADEIIYLKELTS